MEKPDDDNLITLSTLKNRKVYGKNAEYLGRVEDLVIDARNSYIEFAILKKEDADTDGKPHYVAVPTHALHIDTPDAKGVLQVDDGLWRRLPDFDKDRWDSSTPSSKGKFINKFHRRFGMGNEGGNAPSTEHIGDKKREHIEPEESDR